MMQDVSWDCLQVAYKCPLKDVEWSPSSEAMGWVVWSALGRGGPGFPSVGPPGNEQT